jgi:transposase
MDWPPYSSDLNRTEKIWGIIKYYDVRDKIDSVETLEEKV